MRIIKFSSQSSKNKLENNLGWGIIDHVSEEFINIVTHGKFSYKLRKVRDILDMPEQRFLQQDVMIFWLLKTMGKEPELILIIQRLR